MNNLIFHVACDKVAEQLDILSNLNKVRSAGPVHQQIVQQLKSLAQLWASGFLVWGPMLAYAFVTEHPITMTVPEDPLQEAALTSVRKD